MIRKCFENMNLKKNNFFKYSKKKIKRKLNKAYYNFIKVRKETI